MDYDSGVASRQRRSDHYALGFGFFLGFLIGPLHFCPDAMALNRCLASDANGMAERICGMDFRMILDPERISQGLPGER